MVRPRLTSLVAMAAAGALVLGACGSDDGGGSASGGDGGGGGDQQLAVMLPTPSNDLGWSQAMAEAATDVAGERGLDLDITDNAFDPTESRPSLEQYLAGDVPLVVVHGFNFTPVVDELAPQHADRFFSEAAFREPQANIAVHTFSYLEAGYSMCWLGARLSESGTIGMVGASPAPFNVETHEGCEIGAEAAVPGTTVLEAYANDFVDPQKGREQAQALVDQGADVLFVSGGVGSSAGALSLCGELDIPCMGVNVDQSPAAPEAVVASAAIDWRPFLGDLLDRVEAGDAEGFVYNATYGNGGLVVPTFDGPSADKVPAEVQEEFAAMIDELASEAIELPDSTAHPGHR